MTMVTKTAALIFAACTAAFVAFVGALLLTVFELHPAWMAMLLTASVLFIAVAWVLLFTEHSAAGRKKLYRGVLLLVLLAGGGTVGWEWYTEDLEMAEGRGIDLYT